MRQERKRGGRRDGGGLRAANSSQGSEKRQAQDCAECCECQIFAGGGERTCKRDKGQDQPGLERAQGTERGRDPFATSKAQLERPNVAGGHHHSGPRCGTFVPSREPTRSENGEAAFKRVQSCSCHKSARAESSSGVTGADRSRPKPTEILARSKLNEVLACRETAKGIRRDDYGHGADLQPTQPLAVDSTRRLRRLSEGCAWIRQSSSEFLFNHRAGA